VRAVAEVGPIWIRGGAVAALREEIRRREAGCDPALRRRGAELREDPLHLDHWLTMDRWDRPAALLARMDPDTDALLDCGRRLARTLLERPLFRAEVGVRSDSPWWMRGGHLLVALPSSLFSHSSWVLVPEPDRFTIEVSAAADIPESARRALEGVLEVVAATVVGGPVRLRGERPAVDRMIFRGRPVA